MLQKNFFLLFLIIIAFYYHNDLLAASQDKTYHKVNQYIKLSLALTEMPKARLLWPDKELRKKLRKILKNKPPSLRYRYWQKDHKTVWIINAIGKVLPITAGITIKEGKIINITILAYRESHGSEIKYTSYISQFEGAALNKKSRLNKPINGISGATLSVNATKKMARMALLLDKAALLDKTALLDKEALLDKTVGENDNE